jgi:hypothetical protein
LSQLITQEKAVVAALKRVSKTFKLTQELNMYLKNILAISAIIMSTSYAADTLGQIAPTDQPPQNEQSADLFQGVIEGNANSFDRTFSSHLGVNVKIIATPKDKTDDLGTIVYWHPDKIHIDSGMVVPGTHIFFNKLSNRKVVIGANTDPLKLILGNPSLQAAQDVDTADTPSHPLGTESDNHRQLNLGEPN